MNDTLVDRLRARAIESDRLVVHLPNGTSALCSEAADLIEANATEIRQLRKLIDLQDTAILDMQAALLDIAEHKPDRSDFSAPTDAWTYCRERARKALT